MTRGVKYWEIILGGKKKLGEYFIPLKVCTVSIPNKKCLSESKVSHVIVLYLKVRRKKNK